MENQENNFKQTMSNFGSICRLLEKETGMTQKESSAIAVKIIGESKYKEMAAYFGRMGGKQYGKNCEDKKTLQRLEELDDEIKKLKNILLVKEDEFNVLMDKYHDMDAIVAEHARDFYGEKDLQ